MQQLISVGIDIGTSTTQVIYSRLSVDDTSYASQLSQMEIVDKEILYKGRIYMTPIVQQKFLAIDALKTILNQEFEASGIRREDVASGAVIITGEAANKENAAGIAEALAEYAGDLVVAIAGPDLEGILAGIGSGAQQKAREKLIRLVNFDIGGGTSNAAVFDKGKLADAYALHIGGRLIQFDAAHRVTYCSPFIHKMLQAQTPGWMTNPIYLICTGLALLWVICFGRWLIRLNNTFFIFDTIGLALFTVVGVEKSIALGYPFWVAIIMGSITGAAGGVIRDVFINEIPLIFRKEIYAMACVVGGIAYWICDLAGIESYGCQLIGGLVVFLTRILAVKYHICLPILKGGEETED